MYFAPAGHNQLFGYRKRNILGMVRELTRKISTVSKPKKIVFIFVLLVFKSFVVKKKF